MNDFTRHRAGRYSPNDHVHEYQWQAELARLKKSCADMSSDILKYQIPNMEMMHYKVGDVGRHALCFFHT